MTSLSIMVTPIPGYTLGSAPRSPLGPKDLELLRRTLLFDQEDEQALRRSKTLLQDHVDEILDVWYGFVGSQPHLLAFFSNPEDGQPQADYLAAVRARFGRWILDTAAAQYDQKWLDYQHEIGRRHHRSGKNTTDSARAAANIDYRYLPALLVPITTTLKPFLARGGAAPEEVDRMHQAWVKSVLLQVILWSHPYVKAGDF